MLEQEHLIRHRHQSHLRSGKKLPSLLAKVEGFILDRFPHLFLGPVLTNEAIQESMLRGDVVIDQFREDRLQTSSYDVSLGENYWKIQPLGQRGNLFNPHNPKHVRKLWGTQPLRAKTVDEIRREAATDEYTDDDWEGLRRSDPVIILGPGETILAHTEEFIGGRNNVTTMMKARSSWGRAFLSVCKDAGWGDVGYINRWTMEIENNLKHYATVIPVGQPIAQIIFFGTRPIFGRQYEGSGNYQQSSDLETVKKLWTPESMLPRLKRKSSRYDI